MELGHQTKSAYSKSSSRVFIVFALASAASYLPLRGVLCVSWKNTLGDILDALESADEYEVVTPRRLPPEDIQEGGAEAGASSRWRREEAAPLRVYLPSSASGHLLIDLWPSGDVVASGAQALWPNGHAVPLRPLADCLHSGSVRGLPGSLVALSTCGGGLTGLLRLRERTLLVRPLGGGTPDRQEHLLFRARGANLGMDTEEEGEVVTGDIFHRRRDGPTEHRPRPVVVRKNHREGSPSVEVMAEGGGRPGLKTARWPEGGVLQEPRGRVVFSSREDREEDEEIEEDLDWSDEEWLVEEGEGEDDWMRSRRDLKEDLRDGNEEEDEVGFAVEETSEEEPLAGGRRPLVVSVPPAVPDHMGATLAQQAHATTRWLKMAIAVDHTVVRFHGRENAAQYVLALMNIVSAIYKDPSLDSNLRIVIVRMIFYDNEKDGQVEEGNPKQSLEHVNAWNENLLKSIEVGPRHDVAVWLTRLDLGGPSGYAPVSGACDPARSCALNRDEGLSSAFIIAHEVGHVLGMTHDGDLLAGNDCGAEAQEGSVMAPMVAAAFNRFHWSPCSRDEFHSKAPQWTCLNDPPPHSTNATVLGSSLHATFSMDEQCRLEFGDGYTLCHSFELPDPCTHLWCSHHSSPLVCKTKKGPPLEGTECGYDKWCVNGFCETADRKQGGSKSVVRYNARDGGWSSWSEWGPCSRSCGHGITFRTRTCDNPKPEFGGLECLGSSEQFEVCARSRCPHVRDFRAEQCAKLTSLIPMERRLNSLTWLPHELEPVTHKCQLACVSKETGEVYASGENLIDGTPCSYDLHSGICVQGHCQDMGCDGELDSEVREDFCGRCGGNGSSCQNVTLTFKRLLRRREWNVATTGLTRVAVLPRGARNIKVEAHSELMDPPVTFLVLRDRRKRAFALTGQENCIQRSGRTHSCAEGVKIPRSANVVAEGALFHYEHHGPLQTLWARGPLLAELVLSVSVLQVGAKGRQQQTPIAQQVRIQGSYTAADEDVAGAAGEGRYEWREGVFPGSGSKWSPCSVTCGGGRQHKNLVCTDTKAGKVVPRRLCSLALKPQNPTRPCNTFRTMGALLSNLRCTGVQSREIYCVHSNASSLIKRGLAQPWDHFVDPIRCGGPGWQWPRPTGLDSVTPCNRIPCPVEWVTGNWSQCVAKGDGLGVWGEERRVTRCPAPRGEPLFTCGRPPPEHRPCKVNRPKECTQDSSVYCPQVSRYLGRYCLIPEFRDICCETCRNIQPDHYL